MRLRDDKPRAVDRKVRMRRVPVFADLTDAELELLDAALTEVPVAAGKRLTAEGDVGREFVVIVEGLASVVKDGIEVARLGPDSFFGEHALLHNRQRTADVVALTPMRLLVASTGEFALMIRELPTLAQRILVADEARQRGDADAGDGDAGDGGA